MIVVDGHFWRVPGAGAIREAADSDLAPFAVVTSFRPERSIELASVVSIDNLLRQLDRLRTSNNLFFAVRIDGCFSRMHTRAVCTGAGVANAAANQAEFELREIVGTIVGFWTPGYAKTVNIADWHLHFLSKDRSDGGHLLDVAGSTLKAQLQHLDDFRMAIPESPEFLKADPTRDPSKALDKAERVQGSSIDQIDNLRNARPGGYRATVSACLCSRLCLADAGSESRRVGKDEPFPVMRVALAK